MATIVQSRNRRVTSSRGPIVFFVSLFVIALAAINFAFTLQMYAINLADLNRLKRRESSLVQEKQDLENNVSRWSDKAYVATQARERLGFVFPGEQAVRIEHREAVSDAKSSGAQAGARNNTNKQRLPWYSELAYAIAQSDKPTANQPASGADEAGSITHTVRGVSEHANDSSHLANAAQTLSHAATQAH